MFEIRPADARGHADFGWLRSRHTFSFGSYHDPRFMGFSALRVINDDWVAPGAGFDTHGHRDMEILSYVTSGTIEHRDSTGHSEQLDAGEFQLMSAGTGVTHSEYNAHRDRALEFLQIWITPSQTGLSPGYQQKRFDPGDGLTVIASPDERAGSLRINQDAVVQRLTLSAGNSHTVTLDGARRGYVHTVRGSLALNDAALQKGDGAFIDGGGVVALNAQTDAEALVFDLP